MAKRRMFSLDVVDTDVFLDLPASSQSLYFHLGMRADDDGFVSSPKRITAMVNASGDDLKLLIAKGFIIPFEAGVCVIRDWKVNNYIQSDRYAPSIYIEEKQHLRIHRTGEKREEEGRVMGRLRRHAQSASHPPRSQRSDPMWLNAIRR